MLSEFQEFYSYLNGLTQTCDANYYVFDTIDLNITHSIKRRRAPVIAFKASHVNLGNDDVTY